MILIEGPDQHIRATVLRELRQRLPTYEVQPDNPALKLPALVKLLNGDHRHVIRDGFTVPEDIDKGDLYMLGMALASTGTSMIICGRWPNEIFVDNDRDLFRFVQLSVHDFPIISDALDQFIPIAERELASANDVWRFGSLGGRATRGRMVMLVGEGPKPARDGSAQRAFLSATGCSRFLHGILQGLDGRFYLTNANKTPNARESRLLLAEEIELVNPVKIVGMGEVAQRVLADLGVEFTRTYHPQYWARFRRSQQDELAAILRP